MTQKNKTNSQKSLKENNSSSLQSVTEEFMVLKSSSTSKDVLKESKRLQWVHYTRYYSLSRKRDSLSLPGEKATDVELDEGITPVHKKEKIPSTISCSSKPDCCKNLCHRTWVANKLGKAVAYLVLDAGYAEEWMNDIDNRRRNLIENGEYRHPIIIELFDLGWTLQLAVKSVSQWLSWFKER